MSIDHLIKARVQDGMLFPIKPKAAGTSARRAMFVSGPLWEILDSPESNDQGWEERIGLLQADLELFATAAAIYPSYLFLLYHPREAVWKYAVSVQIRLLGF